MNNYLGISILLLCLITTSSKNDRRLDNSILLMITDASCFFTIAILNIFNGIIMLFILSYRK